MKLYTLLLCALLTIIDHIERVRSQVPYYQQQNNIPINVDCERRIQQDSRYLACRARAYETWLPVTDESERIHYTCCYQWDLYDCMVNAMEEACGVRGSSFELYSRGFDSIRNYETYMCAYYPYGSYKCHFPGWAIALIVIGGILLIAVISGLVFVGVRKRRSNNVPNWASYSKTSKQSNTELKTAHTFEETT